ncbi:MAG: caspase family protein [Burkholderiales bacterium]|nr:caspase family protein [Burkholderiales bacterium]
MKRALIIGIDDYPDAPLHGCVNDARTVATTLEKNGDGSPNFAVRLLTSDAGAVTSEEMAGAVDELFKADAEIALLFFAGHGAINPETNSGYIVSQDGRRGSWGVSLSEIIALANAAYPRIRSTVIILDSCHSGFAGEVTGANKGEVSIIGTGVTILTASHRQGSAGEAQGHGIFTDMLVDALTGSAADICGRITPASVYSHIDQALGPWEQRPVYKANVQTFITLRGVAPKIPLEVLRRLPVYFPDAAYVFPLDPSFEPDRANVPEQFRALPIDIENTKKFKELQSCNRHGLVVPVDAEHMYDAAIGSKGCRLTALGAHYRKLAEMARL